MFNYFFLSNNINRTIASALLVNVNFIIQFFHRAFTVFSVLSLIYLFSGRLSFGICLFKCDRVTLTLYMYHFLIQSDLKQITPYEGRKNVFKTPKISEITLDCITITIAVIFTKLLHKMPTKSFSEIQNG